MNFSQGHSGTKVQCESCLFSQGKTPEFTKMGEIHELFVLALSLVWFAGATPDIKKALSIQHTTSKTSEQYPIPNLSSIGHFCRRDLDPGNGIRISPGMLVR